MEVRENDIRGIEVRENDFREIECGILKGNQCIGGKIDPVFCENGSGLPDLQNQARSQHFF